MLSSKSKILILIILGIFFTFLVTNKAISCGPFFPDYIYTPEGINENSDLLAENEKIIDGDYEIILDSWGARSLYPIYRDLTNRDISPELKEKLLCYYKNNCNKRKEVNPVEKWKEARKIVTDEKIQIQTYARTEDWYSFKNCLDDSFLTAAETLRKRAKIYNQDQLETWLEGQDEVFDSCDEYKEDNKKTGLSSSALASLNQSSADKQNFLVRFFSKIARFFSNIFSKVVSFFHNLFTVGSNQSGPESGGEEEISPAELLKQDREYQKAAVSFYKGNFDDAERRFRAISNSKDHVWGDYAALVLGRTYIRKAPLEYFRGWDSSESLKVHNKQLELAKDQFQKILNDPSLNKVHRGTWHLLDYVNYRIDPKQRLEDAEKVLLNSDNPKEIIRNLNDYSLLCHSWVRGEISEENEDYILKKGDDFSQWYYVWTNPKQNNLEFALQKYQRTKSLHWLLASLKLMKPDYLSKDKIIAETLNIPRESPTYFTFKYHRLKLLSQELDKKEQVKQELEDTLQEINPDETPVLYNYFSDLRMRISDNTQEALNYSERKIIGTGGVGYMRGIISDPKKGTTLDKKAKKTLNELLPLEQWIKITSEDSSFSKDVTEQVRLTAFVRAILLGDFENAQKIAKLLSVENSELEKDLEEFIQVKGEDEKRFTATLFVLKHPLLNNTLGSTMDRILVNDPSIKKIDDYRRNWWCHDRSSTEDNTRAFKKNLSEQDIKKAQKENQIIDEIVAPNFLTKNVINYASKNPNDSRVPEALHLSVLATRYARCKDEKTTKFSQKAFQFLHNNYPNNYWTQQTPYWY